MPRKSNSAAPKGRATINGRKYLAELLGTFGLTLAVALSLAGKFPIPTPVIAGLTLGLFVYTIGHLSGAHINPAVTIGAWLLKKIGNKDAAYYILAQFVGAGLACLISSHVTYASPLIVANSWQVLAAEALGAFFFTFGIASIIFGKVPQVMSGIVIGASLMLGIAFAAPWSNGVLNPAVAWGIGSWSFAYLAGPIIGAILGMQASRIFNEA
jgi:aquaporin Z